MTLTTYTQGVCRKRGFCTDALPRKFQIHHHPKVKKNKSGVPPPGRLSKKSMRLCNLFLPGNNMRNAFLPLFCRWCTVVQPPQRYRPAARFGSTPPSDLSLRCSIKATHSYPLDHGMKKYARQMEEITAL